MKPSKSYDYTVVGAGSVGCVIANRLSESAEVRVLLIEQGPRNRSWKVRIPGATAENYKPGARHMRWLATVPQRHHEGRVVDQPLGYGLGGSSLVNGMVYLRGHPFDFDRWEREGACGWSYPNILPYFKRMEKCQEGADQYRGGDGPVGITRRNDLDPLSAAFLDAGAQAGYPFTDDVNGYRQEGFCRFDMNVDAGYRASSSYAYLEKAGHRPNLEILTGAVARRLLVERLRVTGVELAVNRRITTVLCEREVILCSGAVGSPCIMLRSGIGPADELIGAGIKPIHDLPGVGKNLQDHAELDLQWRSTRPITLNVYAKPHRMFLAGLQWLLFKSGAAASGHVSVGAFIRSNPNVTKPDIQFHFLPVCLDGWKVRPDVYGFQVSAGPVNQSSRGSLKLRSSDPEMPPFSIPTISQLMRISG